MVEKFNPFIDITDTKSNIDIHTDRIMYIQILIYWYL